MILIQWVTFLFIFGHGQGVTENVTFEKKKIRFNNGVELSVEVAKSDAQRTQGLMFRKTLPAGTGMLFVFPAETELGFWMKNTFIPLSIGYFNSKRELIEIIDMQPPVGPVRDEMLPRYPSTRPAMYAIEVPLGWFSEKKIRPKATFSFKK